MEFKRHPNTNNGLEEMRQLIGGSFEKAKDQFGEIRKAGSILTANPIGAIVSDLIFPDPVSSGTLTDTMERFGPSVVNRNPTATYNPIQ